MRTRKVERKRTDIGGQCCTNQGRLLEIVVCDLTEGGCRFRDADASLFPGMPVNLMISGSGPYACYVRWREDSDVGVSFARPLSPTLLEQLLNGKPPAAAPQSVQPAKTEGAEPPAEIAVSPYGPLRRIC